MLMNKFYLSFIYIRFDHIQIYKLDYFIFLQENNYLGMKVLQHIGFYFIIYRGCTRTSMIRKNRRYYKFGKAEYKQYIVLIRYFYKSPKGIILHNFSDKEVVQKYKKCIDQDLLCSQYNAMSMKYRYY